MLTLHRVVLLILTFVLCCLVFMTASSTKHSPQLQQSLPQQCALPPANMVSWWAGDDNANDIQGGNNGTLQNGATFAPGKVGQAFSFDGVDDDVLIPDSPSLNPLNAISIEAWFATTSTGGVQFLVNKSNLNSGTSSDDSYTLYIDQRGQLFWQISTTTSSRSFIAPTPSVLDGKFHHVAATYDGSIMQLFLDGNRIGTANITGQVQNVSTPLMLGAGLFNGTPAGILQGILDEVGFYNRALTASEIQAIYNAGGAGKCKPEPQTTASYFSDPAPSTTSLPTEVVLRKELSGYGNYGAADGRADILYTGQVATWHFTLPASVDPQSLRRAFFRVSLVADDHGTDLSQYAIAVRTNGIDSFSGPAGVPHGAPVGTSFTNWVRQDYESTVKPSNYSFTLFNTSTTGSGDWLAVDWVELHLSANTTFQDDFNRPDGVVGNGWSSWWDGQFNHSNTGIVNGELITRGFSGAAGGIFRSLPVTFPLQFSFDFRTLNQVDECNASPFNDGGWGIVFNAASSSSPPPYNAPKQLTFYQFAGSRIIGRTYQTTSGDVSDSVPGLPGQRDYKASPATHIEGVVNADLSATITVRYNDGQTPDPLTFSFGPATNPVATPPGSIFVLSNVNCSSGPHIFDNLFIGPPVPLSSLSLNPITVAGGQSSTGTVTLQGPAPPSGATITLSGSDTAVATVPASITIAEGATSGTFTVNTNAPTSDSTVSISASYQGVTRSASLTVTAPRPDLQVSSLNAPAQAVTDSAFDLSWTDMNGGQGRANSPWADKIFLSTDNQLGNDTELATAPLALSLDAGQSTPTRIQTLSLPRAAVPTDGRYYLIVLTDAGNNVDEGSNENNNWRAAPITLSRPAFPDLMVDSIQAPPTAFFDQTVTVRWTVKNTGNGSTNASEWHDRLSLSPNQAGGDDATQLDVSNASYLDAGESYVASADVHVPRGLFGAYYFIVRTDSGNAVAEDNESNNTRSQAISLQVPPLPDLQVPLVQGPESGFAGQPMQLNWRVENHGTGNTPSAESAWLDGIYLSKTQTLDASARLIGSRQHDGGLAHDDGYTVSNFSLNIPVDIVGDWYVFIVADYQNKVYEFVSENNNNNYDTRHAIRIQATPPDLIVPAIETQGSGAAGGQMTVNWTAQNQGAFDASPNWFDTVYLSADATLDPATDTPLATVFHNGSLGPGLNYNASANITLPACISGAYYLLVFTDSRNQIFEFDPNFNAEQNNFSQAQPIQVTLTRPDLRVTAVSNPQTGNAGQPVSVTWTVTNQGIGATVESSWEDNVYLSPTPMFDKNTALLAGSFTHSGTLAGNNSYTRTESVTLPANVIGVYYVLIWTDTLNQVEECANEGNNISDGTSTIDVANNLSPPPDLIITSVNAPGSAFAGQTITAQWTGNNTGPGAIQTNTAWNDSIYFSADTTLDNNDTLLATKLINGPLAASASYTKQAQATLPLVSAGTYYLIIKADSDDYISEGQHENNNIGYTAIPVSVPNVDLQVSAVDAPAQAFSGQEMPVSWTAQNTGAMQTFAAQWTDYVLLSRDQILDPTDSVIGFKIHTGTLDSGASYTASVNATVPPGLSGPYYVFVRADYHNQLAETDENNNTGGPAALTLQLPPPVDLTVTGINPPATGSPGEPSTFQWTVQNAGANTANGSWTDTVYLSTDLAWDINDALVGRVNHIGPLAPGQTYEGELSAALPAVDPGQYHIIVRTDIRNRVRELDETNNTTASTNTTAIDVPELQLGVPYNTTLQTGQERYHKVNAPANETLLYTLHTEQQDSSTELFARFGATPSRSAFDYLFSRPNEADQEIVIPNTLTGFYYDLMRGVSVSVTTPATIKAETIPFSIRSVSPNRIGDNGQVTITLHGARFQDGATVKLVGNGTTLTAAKVMALDNATVKARFFFTNVQHGTYDVQITNPDGSSSSKQNALTIEDALPLLAVVEAEGNTTVLRGRAASVRCVIINKSNVDIPYTSVGIAIGRELNVEILGPNERLPRSQDLPTDQWVPWSTIRRGNTESAFILRDLEVDSRHFFAIRTSSLTTGSFIFSIDAIASTQAQAESAMSQWAEDLRQELINRPDIIISLEAQAALSDPIQWERLMSSNLISVGLIDIPLGGGVPSNLIGKVNKDYQSNNHENMTRYTAATPLLSCNELRRFCRTLRSLERLCSRFLGPFAQPGCTQIDLGRIACENSVTACQQIECHNAQLVWATNIDREGIGSYTAVCMNVVAPRDPNDKVGVTGFGPQAFIGYQRPLPYTIDFENVPTATAAAQRIRITDQLDPNLDARTFRLKEIGFGSYRIQVPENRAFYQTRVQLGADLGNLLADISAGVDIATGQVTWTLTAIDPQTGEQPTSAALGLLPPNDETGRGQGYVTYTVQPKATALTGTQIANSATITFDTEEPITTNTVTNTLDADAPASAVAQLPASSQQNFTVFWSGDDIAGGSGLQSYDIWVSENDGPYQPFISGTTETSAQFIGNPGSTYRFYSIARDSAGNVEAAPTTPDSITSVPAMVSTGSPVTVQLGNITVTFTNVSATGTVTAIPIDPNSAGTLPPGNTLCSGCPAYDISTTATYSGPINICFNLPSIADQATFSHLKVFHGEGGDVLVDRTTGQNFNLHVLCSSVPSLSPFVVAQGVTPTAAPVTISGQVMTSESNPLGGAVVMLSGAGAALAITDSNGNYRFENLEAGDFYTVTPLFADYTFIPASRSFSLVENRTDAMFTAIQTAVAANPLDTTEFFVRQHYLDFLSREPEFTGLAYWSARLSECGGDSACLRARRLDVSAAFFLSAEFQDTGSFIYRLYKASFGVRPTFAQFTSDRRRVIGGPQLEASKQAFVDEWVRRNAFKQQYPDSLTNAEFVNRLFDTAGLLLSNAEREAAILQLNQGARRAEVLSSVVDSEVFKQREHNSAFVLMEYFGYLRRDPEEAGYQFWLDVLENRAVGSYQGMVCAFVTSAEYQQRFSSVVTHDNRECGR